MGPGQKPERSFSHDAAHVYYKGYNVREFCCKLFRIFEIKLLCFVVAMSDLVHDVDAMHDLCYRSILTSDGSKVRRVYDLVLEKVNRDEMSL